MTIMVRRCFISCQAGHVQTHTAEWDAEQTIADCYNRLISLNWGELGFSGVALALEAGKVHGGIHIQGYVEHKQMRFSTLSSKLGIMPTAMSIVQNSKGSYEYCTGTGAHSGKEGVLRNFEWGSFKLHGDTQRADLKMMVDLVTQGATATSLCQEFPYAWCVHRDRLIKFMRDLEEIERRGRLDITRPP